MAAEAPLAALCALLNASLAQRGEMLCVKDAATGAYVYVNDAWARFAGREPAQLLGRSDSEVFDAALVATWRAAEQTVRSQAAPLLSEHHFDWRDARHDFHVLRLYQPADAGAGGWLCSLWADQRPAIQQQQQLAAALGQIEQLQRANEQLRRELADQALRDQASGLHNRTHFEEQLRRELDLSTREQREFAVVLIDVDPPAEADSIFEALGQAIRSGTRAMDASCRLEGARFAVLLSGVGLATAHSRMEGLRRQCATQIVMRNGRELRFTVSMGVASYPHTANGRDALMQAAQGAVEQAQRRGGNQVALASIRFEG